MKKHKGQFKKGHVPWIKGKYHSKKTKTKMSKLASLRIGTKNGFWGKKHSEKAKKKMRLNARFKKGDGPWLGKKRPPFSKECRDRMSLSHLGKKNSAYIDGRRSHGQHYPYEFKVIREKIRKRDGYKCQLCGVSQKKCRRKLDVHHIDYDPSNFQEWNLISLCSKCNGKVNFNRKKWTRFFKVFIKKLY